MTPDPKNQKKVEPQNRWQTWRDKLSPTALRALSPSVMEREVSPEGRSEFRAWTEAALTTQASEVIYSMAAPGETVTDTAEPEPEFDASTYRFCLVESPEGDYPRLRMFNDSESLARRIASLEGQEVAVWPFYGLPMSFTKLEGVSPRCLLLPDGTALTIPAFPGQEPEVVVTGFTDNLEIQEDGFMGPPELVGEAANDDIEDH